MRSRITLSDLSLLQMSIMHLYASQCSSASLLNILNCTSSEEFASNNFLHVSRDFWGSDFCHFFTAPTIDGVDDPPVPGSPSSCGKHNNRYEQTVLLCLFRNKDKFDRSTTFLGKMKEEKRNTAWLETVLFRRPVFWNFFLAYIDQSVSTVYVRRSHVREAA